MHRVCGPWQGTEGCLGIIPSVMECSTEDQFIGKEHEARTEVASILDTGEHELHANSHSRKQSRLTGTR